MRAARPARILFTRLLLPTIAVVIVAVVSAQKSGTESSYRYDDSGSLVKTETTYKEGHVVEKKEFDRNGKLRKRTTYTYLKGFNDPNTSTTEYAPDGETPKSTTNVDRDKDGNLTSTVTTNYDGAGKETGGSKRERNPATGRERCYNWNAAKQVYEEIECPKVYVSGVGDDSVPPEDKNAKVETSAGLQTVIFDAPAGTVRVNLPDDMRAGDTISGTVVTAPRGSTDEERARNRINDSYLLEVWKPAPGIIDPRPTAGKESAVVFSIKPSESLTNFTFTIPPSSSGLASQNSIADLVLKNQSGQKVGWHTFVPIERMAEPARTTIFIGLPPPNPKITPTFIIPPLGQTGRPLVITGPFDGNSSNTKLDFQPTVAEAARPPTFHGEWVDFGVVAESPRQAVVTAPSNVTGPMQIRVNENGLQTIGNYRNVGVNLSAPKTILVKGEKTELRVEVNGLEGLKQPVPLTITYRGVIVMEGGPYQPLLIQPSQVSADGRYSTTRGITGIETGGWTATAMVVTSRFDFCLQDDSAPARAILWNTFNGDYSFICPGCLPQRTGETAQTGGAATNVAPSGSPPTRLTGTGTMTRKGCIITLSHNAPDRRIFSRLDVCTNSGSSTVEVPKTNAKFTITDRNMADNTCGSQ